MVEYIHNRAARSGSQRERVPIMTVLDRFNRAYRDACNGLRFTMAFAMPNDMAAGKSWYDVMGAWAVANGSASWTAATSCFVFSAFSPRCTVAQNKARYLAFTSTGHAAGLAEHLRSAIRVAAHGPDALTGRKRIAFGWALAGDPNAVVIDSHACKVCGIDADAPTKVQYDALERAHRDVAPEFGLEPRQLQAVTWVTHRRAAW